MNSVKISSIDNFFFVLGLVGVCAVTWTCLGQAVNYFFVGIIIFSTCILRLRHNERIGFKGVNLLVYMAFISTVVSIFFSLASSSEFEAIKNSNLSSSSLVNSTDNSNPFIIILKWWISLYVLPIFIVVVRRLSSTKYNLMLVFWTLSVSLSAFSAILQRFDLFPKFNFFSQSGIDSNRFAGLCNHPNTLAVLLCLSFPVILILYRRKVFKFRWLIVTGLLFEYSIFLSGSRNGIICSFLIIIFVLIKRFEISRRSRFSGPRFVIVILFLFLLYLIGLVEYVLQNTRLGLSVGRSGYDESSQGRLALLLYGFQVFSSFPITGIGPTVLKTFHNIYLQIAGSFGIIGLFAFFNYIRNLLRIDFSLNLKFEYRLIVYIFLTYGMLNNNLADFYLYFPLGLCYATLDDHRLRYD